MWKVILKFLVWAAEWNVMLLREPDRFCSRRSRFQVAGGQVEGRISRFPFGPVANSFSLWAWSSSCDVEYSES